MVAHTTAAAPDERLTSARPTSPLPSTKRQVPTGVAQSHCFAVGHG